MAGPVERRDFATALTAFLLLGSPPVLAATPGDLATLRYLSADGRADEAARLGAELLAADPTDVSAHITWIQVRVRATPHASSRVRARYQAWFDEDPDDAVRRVSLAWATGLAAEGARYASLPSKPGPWCDEVLDRLEPLPQDRTVRARAIWLQRLTLAQCERDATDASEALIAIAETEPRVRYSSVSLRLQDEVDEDDARAVADLLEAEPWRASTLRRLWFEGAEGPGLEAARASALAKADEIATSDDPALVTAAYAVYRAAERSEQAEACRQRMRTLDPDHFMPSQAKRPTSSPTEAELVSIEERLAAHDERGTKGLGRSQRGSWHRERAKLLEALDRHEEGLDHRRRAYRMHRGYSVNQDYARGALRLNQKLRDARKALDVTIGHYEDMRSSDPNWQNARDFQRDVLVEAFTLRAELNRRLGEHRDARKDASRALLMEEVPMAHLVLGLCTADGKYTEESSFEHLSLGLAAGGSGYQHLDAAAADRLEAVWPEQGWWLPGGTEAWLALVGSRQEAVAADDVEQERVPFPDLELQVDGETRLLSSFEGPLVVDLWATWCGPCRMALPQLDLLARTTPDITFLALSVDEEPEDAGEYLASSEPAFVQVWGGPEAMKAAGVSGIPAVFFLDAEHRIVTREGGWSEGGSNLEEGLRALQRVLGSGEGR